MNNSLTPAPSDRPAMNPRTRAYIRKSKAPNTLRAYKSAFKDFQVWADGRPTLPAEPLAIADYIAHLADAGAAVSTIEQRLAAISFIHRTAGHADPTRAEHVVDTMGGIRRALRVKPHGKEAILREALAAMVRAVARREDETKGAELRQLRDRAILLLGFAGAFRRSELCGLDIKDLRFERESMTVTLQSSKTDQVGQGIVKAIPTLAGPLCPVRAVREWLRMAGIAEGPVFRKVDRWGHLGKHHMSGEAIAQIVKGAANLAGLPYAEMSGHSLRVGFVSQASADGMHTEEIMAVTGHKSPAMVMRYNRQQGVLQMRAIRRALGEDI